MVVVVDVQLIYISGNYRKSIMPGKDSSLLRQAIAIQQNN